jgi:hypothetical protein
MTRSLLIHTLGPFHAISLLTFALGSFLITSRTLGPFLITSRTLGPFLITSLIVQTLGPILTLLHITHTIEICIIALLFTHTVGPFLTISLLANGLRSFLTISLLLYTPGLFNYSQNQVGLILTPNSPLTHSYIIPDQFSPHTHYCTVRPTLRENYVQGSGLK